MLEFILNLIPGGGVTALVGVIFATLAAVFGIHRAGRKVEEANQKVKEAKARAENFERIRMAGAAKPTGDILSDPRNRDIRKP